MPPLYNSYNYNYYKGVIASIKRALNPIFIGFFYFIVIMLAGNEVGNFHIFYGHYLTNTIECQKCGAIFPKPNEKMTDVNIAVEMLTDAFQNTFDTAILISADSDLMAPIRRVKELFPYKRIVVAFPPARFSFALKEIVNASFVIGRKMLAKSVFPEEVAKPDGFILKRPERWK